MRSTRETSASATLVSSPMPCAKIYRETTLATALLNGPAKIARSTIQSTRVEFFLQRNQQSPETHSMILSTGKERNAWRIDVKRKEETIGAMKSATVTLVISMVVTVRWVSIHGGTAQPRSTAGMFS